MEKSTVAIVEIAKTLRIGILRCNRRARGGFVRGGSKISGHQGVRQVISDKPELIGETLDSNVKIWNSRTPVSSEHSVRRM